MWIHIVDSTLFGILYPVTVAIVVLWGDRYAKKQYLKKNKTWAPTGIENGLIGTFGLVISFTLALSGNAVKERNTLIHTEADIIADLNRKTKFYDDAELRKITNNYLLNCMNLQLSNKSPSADESLILINKFEELDNNFDELLIAYKQAHPQAAATITDIIVSAERIGDQSFRLLYSFRERTPVNIILVLVLFSWLMGFLIGFLNNVKPNKNYIIPFIFVMITSLLINTIRDLDNPDKNFITPNYDDLHNIKILVEKNR